MTAQKTIIQLAKELQKMAEKEHVTFHILLHPKGGEIFAVGSGAGLWDTLAASQILEQTALQLRQSALSRLGMKTNEEKNNIEYTG